MCEYTEEFYTRWARGRLTRIEQAFFEEHRQKCPDCSTLSLEGRALARTDSLKFGFGIGLLASVITSIGVIAAIKNFPTYSSHDLIISAILYIPLAIFMGIQISVFKLSESDENTTYKPFSLLRAITTLFVFSALLYSILFNIPALAKASYLDVTRTFEFSILFLNIVLSALYWVVGNRLAVYVYQRQLETHSFVISLLGTWVFITTGISYVLTVGS
jgi:hypothetical protein